MKSGSSILTATAANGKPRKDAVDSLRVLVAEDNAIAGDLLAMMAKRLGAKVDLVVNGLDAVDSVHNAHDIHQPYDLLLIDAMMPALSGPEAARRLRAEGVSANHLPIVAVTAATDPAEVRDYLAAGMQAYLPKPVSLPDLAACFDAWIPRRKRNNAAQRAPSRDLRRRYELRKSEVFAHLEEAIARSTFSPELRDELRTHLHKLAGTAGSFGEAPLSDAAARAEHLIVAAEDKDLSEAVERGLALLKAAA